MKNKNTMFYVTSKEDADKLVKLGFYMVDNSNGFYTFISNGSTNFNGIKVTYTNNLFI